MTHAFSEKITWGEKTDWMGKKLTSQIFPRGKKLTVTPGSCHRGGTWGCWGSKNLARGFGMAPHRLCVLVKIVFILVNNDNPDEMLPYAVFNAGHYNLSLYPD